MQTIHFNTRRLYTEHGQRITATLHDDGVVTFFDHDRMVDGEFKLPDGFEFTQEIVQHAYDRNAAKKTARSHADGLCRGGCNTRYE